MTDTRADAKKRKTSEIKQVSVEKHLLIDDSNFGAMSRKMKVKVGAFLTNLMCKNLKYKVGDHKYMLLKPSVVRGDIATKGIKKYMGFVNFNKGFLEDFVGELDKIHDLNL